MANTDFFNPPGNGYIWVSGSGWVDVLPGSLIPLIIQTPPTNPPTVTIYDSVALYDSMAHTYDN